MDHLQLSCSHGYIPNSQNNWHQYGSRSVYPVHWPVCVARGFYTLYYADKESQHFSSNSVSTQIFNGISSCISLDEWNPASWMGFLWRLQVGHNVQDWLHHLWRITVVCSFLGLSQLLVEPSSILGQWTLYSSIVIEHIAVCTKLP